MTARDGEKAAQGAMEKVFWKWGGGRGGGIKLLQENVKTRPETETTEKERTSSIPLLQRSLPFGGIALHQRGGRKLANFKG